MQWVVLKPVLSTGGAKLSLLFTSLLWMSVCICVSSYHSLASPSFWLLTGSYLRSNTDRMSCENGNCCCVAAWKSLQQDCTLLCVEVSRSHKVVIFHKQWWTQQIEFIKAFQTSVLVMLRAPDQSIIILDTVLT